MAGILVIAGYGGHAGYARAILHYLVEEFGVERSQIDILVPKGYEWVVGKLEAYGNIHRVPLPRRPNESLLRTLHRWPLAEANAFQACKGHRVVLATGSNFSLAYSLPCLARRARVFVVEALDRIITASRTPLILSKLGATPLLSWKEQRENYPSGIVVGPIYEPATVKAVDKGYILVTTGTLGLPRLYKALAEAGVDNAVIQSGDIPPEHVRKLNPKWRVFQYTPRLEELIAGASLVITHFPGMTAATARLAYRKPVVIVQSYRHRLSSSPREGPLLARKLNTPYITRITRNELEKAIEEAPKLETPQYPIGARYAAKIITTEYKQALTGSY